MDWQGYSAGTPDDVALAAYSAKYHIPINRLELVRNAGAVLVREQLIDKQHSEWYNNDTQEELCKN